MEALFYLVPSVMIAGAVYMLCWTLGRTRQVSAAWNSGITAEGRCLRTYTRTSGGGGDSSTHTTLHHVYEFTTRDGRPVRFDEDGGPSTTVEGDIVTVYYTPDRPERATARPPGRGKLLAGTGCMVAFCALFIAMCVFFMVAAHWSFAETDDFAP